MAEPSPMTRRHALTAGAWAVPAVSVAAAAPALAASTGQGPWESSRWGMEVNAPYNGTNLSISFQLDSGQTAVPGGSTFRVWVDDVELTVVDWHSAAWVTIGSNDTVDPFGYEVTITVEIATPTGAVHTLVSPPVHVFEHPDLP